MTFQQLTYVVEIAKCGSINKAAHKLLLSQSGISTAVRELEQELGIQFFLRLHMPDLEISDIILCFTCSLTGP